MSFVCSVHKTKFENSIKDHEPYTEEALGRKMHIVLEYFLYNLQSVWNDYDTEHNLFRSGNIKLVAKVLRNVIKRGASVNFPLTSTVCSFVTRMFFQNQWNSTVSSIVLYCGDLRANRQQCIAVVFDSNRDISTSLYSCCRNFSINRRSKAWSSYPFAAEIHSFLEIMCTMRDLLGHEDY